MDAMFFHLLILFAGRVAAEKSEALFVFGDSFADTGNRNPYNQSENETWRRPYGFTWPGYPAGRFSSGKIQPDFWADILGLPPPIRYELLKSHDCKETDTKIIKGVNFAVGSSAIFRAYGYKTLAEQVKQFEDLISASPGFDSHKLSRSVVLISMAGNDYGFLADRNGSIEEMIYLVKPVVSGTMEAVKELYKSGLRNFAVSNVYRFGCGPQIGKTSCDPNYGDFLGLHTRLLKQSVESLKSDVKELSIIITDLVSAIDHIFSRPAQFGFKDLFVPCCAEKGGVDKCGEVDERGRALFEVCSDVDEKFYWDAYHPTERGWDAIMSLYSNGASQEDNKTISFVVGAQNIIEWVEYLGFVVYNIPCITKSHVQTIDNLLP